jgi:hypothetical protein
MKDILPLLKSLLSGDTRISIVNQLVYYTQQIAIFRIYQLIELGKLDLSYMDISIKSAAVDCIGEIFRRDREGHYIEFEEYFRDEKDLNNLNDDNAQTNFRNFVFLNLQDGIARLYARCDPIFSKIYRNIRIYLRQQNEIKKFERFGEFCIYSCDFKDINKRFPPFPIDEIEYRMGVYFKGKENIGQYLELIMKILNDQNEYQRFCSIADAAYIIKRIMSRRIHSYEAIYTIDDNIVQSDFTSIIARTIHSSRFTLREIYVKSGKISEELFVQFFNAIEEIIYQTFVEKDGELGTYFKYVQKYLPKLSYNEYRSKYHHQFEYMAKFTQKNVYDQLKEL